MDGRSFFVARNLIVAIGLSGDLADFGWIADKVKGLAILKVFMVNKIRQIEFIFLFGHCKSSREIPIGRNCRLFNSYS